MKLENTYFKKELYYALRMINDENIPISYLKGPWAGASGQPQFMPSSWFHYAVDHDGDGMRDIWHSESDSLASIANYLKAEGWQNSPYSMVEIKVPDNLEHREVGFHNEKTIHEWEKLGINLPAELKHVDKNIRTSIFTPTGGPTLMLFPNFKVIMKYNHSIYYAGAISNLADKICKRK